MSKYTEQNVPKNLIVKVNHFHNGNSSKRMRHGKDYLTRCQLIDRETGELMGYGTAECHKGEAPRREVGRAVAVGRALKDYFVSE